MNMQCRDSFRTRQVGRRHVAGGGSWQQRENRAVWPISCEMGERERWTKDGGRKKEGGRNLERTRFSRAPFRSCLCEGGGGGDVCPAAAATVGAKCGPRRGGGGGGGGRRGLFWQWSHFRCLISHGIDFNTTLSRRGRSRGRKRTNGIKLKGPSASVLHEQGPFLRPLAPRPISPRE